MGRARGPAPHTHRTRAPPLARSAAGCACAHILSLAGLGHARPVAFPAPSALCPCPSRLPHARLTKVWA
eukprot:4744325-Prymnesium_polylepis.1